MSCSGAAVAAVGTGGLLVEGCRSWTKLSGNIPRTPFSTPSHQPSSTCWREEGWVHGTGGCAWEGQGRVRMRCVYMYVH